MQMIIYWAIKVFLWVCFVFCAYSIVCPKMMLKFLLKAFQLKMKWFGFKGTIEPGDNAQRITRLWSAVTAFIFGGMIYAFSQIFTLAYVLR